MKRFSRIAVVLVAMAVAATTVAMQPALTSGQTKLTMVFVPSGESEAILASGKQIGKMLSDALGRPVEAVVATSYVAAVEAMCANRADVGALNPFGYVLANAKCGVEVGLISMRFGLPYYRSQINVRAGAGITKLEDLRGKRFAYVDAVSTSGNIFPRALLKSKGFDPDRFFGQTIFAGSHPNVILAIYRGQVDGGATFEDARGNVARQFPDVFQKVEVIEYTKPIPNDTWSFNPRLSASLKAQIKKALLDISASDDGKKALRTLYSIEGLADQVALTVEATKTLVRIPPDVARQAKRSGDRVLLPLGDWYFDVIRDAAKFLNLDLQKLAGG